MNHSDAIEYNRILFGISKAHNNLKHFNANIELANRKTINNLMTWKYDSRKDKINILKDKIVNTEWMISNFGSIENYKKKIS